MGQKFAKIWIWWERGGRGPKSPLWGFKAPHQILATAHGLVPLHFYYQLLILLSNILLTRKLSRLSQNSNLIVTQLLRNANVIATLHK